MSDETRERFLRLIAEQVSPERIEELHLFAPLRQSGRETGVAVIAVRADAPPATPVEADDVSMRVERLIIYRAQYQLVLKGPDRGKWEADVRAEADAPLSAMDEVVRGVHRRAGDDAEPERLSGDAVRAALLAVVWPTPT